MRAVRLAPLALLLALVASGCSTAASPISSFDDEDEPETADARVSVPRSDAAMPPLSVDAGLPPKPPTPDRRDAGPALLDAGPTMKPPITPVDAGSIFPPFGDAAASCSLHNAPGCALAANPMQPCRPEEPERCLSPAGATGEWFERTCQRNSGQMFPIVTSVQCPHDCYKIPSSFEGLDTSDCAQRPLVHCDSFPSDQRAVDLALEVTAASCGLKPFHLGLIFDAQGCARALFGLEIRDPAIRCIAKLINGHRFTCTPACAMASSDGL